MADQPDMQQIRQVVLGKDAVVPRADAMRHLLVAKPADAHAAFETVLVNQTEDVRFRALAAAHLGRLQTPQAAAALIHSLEKLQHPTVLSAALRVACHVADATTLPILDRLATQSSGAPARLARFAAVLTAHRLNLPGYEVALPSDDKLVSPAAGAPALALQIRPGASTETAAAVASVTKEPLGVPLSKTVGWKIQCAHLEWMLFVNAEFAGPRAMEWVTSRKSVPIVLATHQRESGEYVPALFVLAEPSRDKRTVNLLVYSADGRLSYSGTGAPEGARASFTVRTVAESSALPLRIEGTFDGTSLTTTVATSAASVSSPRPEPPRAHR